MGDPDRIVEASPEPASSRMKYHGWTKPLRPLLSKVKHQREGSALTFRQAGSPVISRRRRARRMGNAARAPVAGANLSTFALFDHLVSKRQQLRRHVEVEGSCCPAADEQFEPRRKLHRQVAWLFALEDAINIASHPRV
jgi:hypothetical protein